MKAGTWKAVAASTLAALIGLAGTPSVAQSQPAKKAEAAQATEDVIIFRNGKTLTGKIISETSTTVRFKGKIAGIDAETDYPMSEILSIKKGVAVANPTAPAGTPVAELPKSGAVEEPGTADTQGKTKIYWMELSGEFGEDISETPVRQALRDAKKNNADIIIVKLDADWMIKDGVVNADLPNDVGAFDGLMRAERIIPVFVDEMRAEWTTQPRVIFWVKQAMGGAAFLPLWCKEIYFTSDARLGGIGNLSQLFGSMGDDVVREKQRSLRLGHAEGWAILGGYNPIIIRAMARIETVLSVRYEDGKPVLFEGYPKDPGDELLTDDGAEGNADTLQQRVRWEGNDVLTLNERTAKLVGLSKGTVDTEGQLLDELALNRTSVVINGRSKQIMKDWTNGLTAAKAKIMTLFEEYQDIQVQGNYQERTRARGMQIRKLEEIKTLLTRWGEALGGWMQENGIPDISTISTQQEQIRLQQLADKK